MADTAHQTQQAKKEYFDSPDQLEEKVQLLAKAVRNSKHFVLFTGAGISTSTGIPDFRSGVDTVLPTGPGCWEKAATKTQKKGVVSTPMLKAIPSQTHMAIVELARRDIIKFVISQNVDGLHRRSGLDPEKLAELHGNTNLEQCLSCKRQFFRDYRCSGKREDQHRTGRKCECGGDLADSIIHFGENLPEKDLLLGYNHSQVSDLHLCLGSSLTVSPANDMPHQTVANGGQLFIVNLQKTPLHDEAVNIHGLCDQVIELLMKKLDIPIPQFQLNRIIHVSLEMKQYILFSGVDVDGTPYSLFSKVVVEDSEQKVIELKQQPFILEIGTFKQGNLQISYHFPGHYNEPAHIVSLDSEFVNEFQPLIFQIAYNPQINQWRNL